MTPSRKSETVTQRPKQKKTKQFGTMQFVLVGAGIIVVIIVALLLSGGGGKKPAASHAKTAAADTGSTYGSVRKPSARVTQRAKRDAERAKLRDDRLQRKRETKATGERTSRSTSGGYTSGSSTRSVSTPNHLRAILTDNSGSRTALVGERRLRAGDDVEGRRIVEVSGDGIKVEYRQSTYSVRVGEKIY
jgi:hypothetical protein